MTQGPYEVQLLEELHDMTPERHIHGFAARLDQAAIGEIVGIRISGDFDPLCTGVTTRSETCLVRMAAGVAELSVRALRHEDRQKVGG